MLFYIWPRWKSRLAYKQVESWLNAHPTRNNVMLLWSGTFQPKIICKLLCKMCLQEHENRYNLRHIAVSIMIYRKLCCTDTAALNNKPKLAAPTVYCLLWCMGAHRLINTATDVTYRLPVWIICVRIQQYGNLKQMCLYIPFAAFTAFVLPGWTFVDQCHNRLHLLFTC